MEEVPTRPGHLVYGPGPGATGSPRVEPRSLGAIVVREKCFGSLSGPARSQTGLPPQGRDGSWASLETHGSRGAGAVSYPRAQTPAPRTGAQRTPHSLVPVRTRTEGPVDPPRLPFPFGAHWHLTVAVGKDKVIFDGTGVGSVGGGTGSGGVVRDWDGALRGVSIGGGTGFVGGCRPRVGRGPEDVGGGGTGSVRGCRLGVGRGSGDDSAPLSVRRPGRELIGGGRQRPSITSRVTARSV